MKLSNIKTDYHRNGISGTGFHVATFTMKEGRKKHHMVGVVFPESGACAVFDIDMLSKDNIEFSMGNSWRGDHFEPELRQVMKENQEKELALYLSVIAQRKKEETNENKPY